MKNLLNLIILFIVAAVVLALIQYFQKPKTAILPIPDNQISTTTQIADKNPSLSPDQEAALERAGIDPSRLPVKLTPELEACFIQKIGAERVMEIRRGALPTQEEFIAGKACIQTI